MTVATGDWALAAFVEDRTGIDGDPEPGIVSWFTTATAGVTGTGIDVVPDGTEDEMDDVSSNGICDRNLELSSGSSS